MAALKTSKLLVAALLSSALVPFAPTSALAGTIEQVESAQVAPDVYPGSAQGTLRTWVQLVWNPQTRALQRLSYIAWDPIPSVGLDLSWQPDDPAGLRSGLIDGKGTLSFRKPGAASYDPSATLAQYRGTLAEGRADGMGEFLDQSGFSYSGEWRDGLMEGEGRLTTAAGDEYVGRFHLGKRDGQGVFTDAAGRTWSGRFSAGLPDAEALLAAEDSTLRIGIVAERRPHNYELGLDPLSYTSKSDGDRLDILPDDPRLLAAWHGTETIGLTDDEIAHVNDPSFSPSFLGAYERFDPLSLVFSLENTTTDALSVVGGYLDVAQSASDPEPAMQIWPQDLNPCSVDLPVVPYFHLANFGWTQASNARLNFTLGTPDGRSEGTPLSLELGNIDQELAPDISDTLAQLGVDTNAVLNNGVTCPTSDDEDYGNDQSCLADTKKFSHFGRLAGYLTRHYALLTVTAAGTLDYDWTAADGTVSHKSSPFTVPVPIGSVTTENECGEGGEIVPLRRDPFSLHLDDKNYKIAIPFSADIAPGFTTRWRIELSAPQTSQHDFSVVLVLADGRRVTSRPVHFTYFMPPKRDKLNLD